MVGQKVNIRLLQIIKGSAFFEDIADILVVLFAAALLPEGIGIAVINGRPPAFIQCRFKRFTPSEFRTSVGQDDPEELPEQFDSKPALQLIKDTQDLILGLR